MVESCIDDNTYTVCAFKRLDYLRGLVHASVVVLVQSTRQPLVQLFPFFFLSALVTKTQGIAVFGTLHAASALYSSSDLTAHPPHPTTPPLPFSRQESCCTGTAAGAALVVATCAAAFTVTPTLQQQSYSCTVTSTLT